MHLVEVAERHEKSQQAFRADAHPVFSAYFPLGAVKRISPLAL